jgi:hypothetical protein
VNGSEFKPMKTRASILIALGAVVCLPLASNASLPAVVAPVTLTVAWNPVSNAAAYTVSYGIQHGVYTVGSQTCTAPVTQLSVSVVPITNYYFVVTSVAANGSLSSNSAEIVYIAPAQAATAPPPPQPPAAPTGMAIVAGSAANSVNASWNSVANVSGYVLYWGTSLGSLTSSNSCGNILMTTVPNLLPNQEYYFAVAALGTNDLLSALSAPPVAYSNAVAVPVSTTNPTPPPPPPVTLDVPQGLAIVVITNNGARGITLSWDPVPNASGYSVNWGTNSQIDNWSSNSSQTLVTLTNLIGGTTDYFAVMALGGTGFNNSGFSQEIIYTNTLASPADLTFTPVTNGIVIGATVAWSPVPDAASYIVSWGPQPGLTLGQATCDSPKTNVLVTSLSGGTLYYFTVVAIATNGNPGNSSAEVTYTEPVLSGGGSVGPAPSPPGPALAPLAVNVTLGPSPNTAIVTWGTTNVAASYLLQFNPGTPNGTVQTPLSSTIISNMTPNTPYVFVVFALDANQAPLNSGAMVTYTNVPPIPPAVPGGFSVLTGTAPNSAMASWGSVPSATGYELYWGATSGNYTLSNSCSSSIGSMSVNGLSTNGVYFFAVATLGTNGTESGFSTEVVYTNVYVPPMPPSAPGGLSVSAGTATNSATASWGAVANVSGYELYWGVASHSYTSSNTYSQPPATISGLATNQTYYFAVAALGTNGLESAFSSEASFSNAAPAAPAFPASTNLMPGIPPVLAMGYPNGQPNLVIGGTIGAQFVVQSTTNPANPLAWTTVGTVTLTNPATGLPSSATNTLPQIVTTAFPPAVQLYMPSISNGVGQVQFFRVSMSNDYATLAYQTLPASNYPTRLIAVYMTGLSDNVCYITNQLNYIYCDSQTFYIDVQSSGSTIRQIASSLSGVLDLSWTMARELSYSNGVYESLATVVQTDPPASDQVAGQQAPSSIQINF